MTRPSPTGSFWTRAARVFVALGLAALSVHSYAAEQLSDDPPSRVARLSFIQGEISLRPAGSEDETKEWTEPTLNRPLTSGDTLWVGRGGRAELQLGSANIHLDQNTSLEFLELGDATLQASLSDGVLHLQVRRLEDGEVVEVDTPQSAVIVKRAGEYRIAVTQEGTVTEVKNYNGDLEVIDSSGSHPVAAREQASFGNEGTRTAGREAIGPRDEFDAWAHERNQRTEKSVASRYVSPDVIGYEDLDAHGHWAHDATYGHVWYPSHVAVDWSPYRYGHWTWVGPWGWTWVDYAPWGFAPFHYGRWAHLHGRWCWVPGPARVRAVYAPALVAWVGGVPGFSVSVSFGHGIGWFPLAPREIYVPGYYGSRRYWHHVNHSNTVIVNNIYINRAYTNRGGHLSYANRGIRNAVTVVNRDTFVGARPVNRHLVRVNDRELRNWRSVGSAPAIVPERASRLSPRGGAGAPREFRRDAHQQSVAHRVNGADRPRRASFEREQQGIRDNGNRPLTARQLRQHDGEQRTASTHSRPDRADNRASGDQSSNDRPLMNRGQLGASMRPDRPPQSDASSPGRQQRPSELTNGSEQARPSRSMRERSEQRGNESAGQASRNDTSRASDFARSARDAVRESRRPAPPMQTPQSRPEPRPEVRPESHAQSNPRGEGRRQQYESRQEPDYRQRGHQSTRAPDFHAQRTPEPVRNAPPVHRQEAPPSAASEAQGQRHSESRGGGDRGGNRSDRGQGRGRHPER